MPRSGSSGLLTMEYMLHDRQVKGLQTEYGRLSDESKQYQGGASTDLSSEVQRCKAALSKAEADRDAAVEKADAAEKARRTAENNADALLTQTKVSLLHLTVVASIT